MSKLALTYHDKAVLEQHHAAISFKALQDESMSILENIDDNQFKTLRKMFIQNILATDMKVHFNIIAKIQNKFKEKGNAYFEEVSKSFL